MLLVEWLVLVETDVVGWNEWKAGFSPGVDAPNEIGGATKSELLQTGGGEARGIAAIAHADQKLIEPADGCVLVTPIGIDHELQQRAGRMNSARDATNAVAIRWGSYVEYYSAATEGAMKLLGAESIQTSTGLGEHLLDSQSRHCRRLGSVIAQ
jgi:hypothetical protein